MIEKDRNGHSVILDENEECIFTLTKSGTLIWSDGEPVVSDHAINELVRFGELELVRTARGLNGEAIRVFNVDLCEYQLRLVEHNGSRTWEIWEEAAPATTWGRE